MKKERNSKLGYAKNGWLYKEKTAGYIFSAPFIFGFLFFVIVPVATSLYYAFCNYNILMPPAVWVSKTSSTFSRTPHFTRLWASR